MAFQPAPDVARVSIDYDYDGTLMSNVLHFAKVDFDEADLADLATGLSATFIGLLMEELTNDIDCLGYTIYDARTSDGPKLIHRFGSPVSGGQDAEPGVALVAAAVVTFYGNGRGKSNQGRAYIPGITETDADQIRVQDAKMDNLVAAFEDLRTSQPPGWTWVILSRYKDGAKRPTATYTPVVSVVARSGIWGRQSRRVNRP